MCLKILWFFLAKHKANPLKNPQGDTWGFFLGWANGRIILQFCEHPIFL